MKTFEVTASNCAHWQTLRVRARDAYTAAMKFQRYIDDNNPRWSREEYDDWVALGVDDVLAKAERSDYVYDFDSEDIKEAEHDAGRDVEMVASGGNG